MLKRVYKNLFQFSLAGPFVGIAVLMMQLVMIADKIDVHGFWRTAALAAFGLCCVLAFVKILDRLKAAQHMEREIVGRSEAWQKLFEDVNEMKEEIKKLKPEDRSQTAPAALTEDRLTD